MNLVGVALAGGAGRRMVGESKPAAMLAGRPLLWWPLEALSPVCSTVAVAAKASSSLPALPPGVSLWIEPDEPQHPVAGLRHALERARAPVLVLAGDMPFVTSQTLAALVGSAAGSAAPAVVGGTEGRLEPLLGLYRPAALDALRSAPLDARLTEVVEALEPARVSVPDRVVRSVNTPDELRAAEAELLSA